MKIFISKIIFSLVFFRVHRSLGLAPYNIFFLLFSLSTTFFLLEKIDNLKKHYIGFLWPRILFISLYWISISFKVANMGGYFLGSLAVFIMSLFITFFSFKLLSY